MRERATAGALWSRISPDTQDETDAGWQLVLPGAVRPSVQRVTRLLVVTAAAADLRPLHAVLRLLAVTGWPLQIWHGAGQVAPEIEAHAEQVDPLAHHSLRGRVLDRAVPAWAVSAAGEQQIVVPVGWRAKLGRTVHRRADSFPTQGVGALGTAVFAEAAARPRLRGSDVPGVLDAAGLLAPGDVPPLGWALVLNRLQPWVRAPELDRFVHAAQRCQVDPVDIGAANVLDSGGPHTGAAWAAAATEHTGRALDRAATHVDQGRRRQAAVVAAASLRLLFDRAHHVHASSSPLISEPASFLQPVTAARSWLVPARPDEVMSWEGAGERRALILAGAYPAFAHGLVRALGEQAELCDLGAIETRFHNTEMEARSLAELLAIDRGEEISSPAGTALLAAMSGAGVVIADWADKGAALASRLVRPGQRLVVRVNGVDHLSAWLHLIRWERVDDVIFVSEHVRRAVDACRIPGMTGVRQHVIPHALDCGQEPARPRLGGRAVDESRHTLGMIGWAQAVKDPVFALDTLGMLRASDPRWRLLLIGARLEEATATDDPFRRQVEQRLEAADVRGAVEITGALSHDEVLALLPRVGYGLSTSRRESLHMGALEMAAAGAVPVVRDWPLYASLEGAAAVFGPDVVVATPAEAARLIRCIDGDPEERGRIVEATRSAVLRHHDLEHVSARLAAVVWETGATRSMA